MKVAVLMSTYNGEKFLEEQIESILNQDCNAELMLIIRDDGSNDSTIDILEKYAQKYKNIVYESGLNIGAAQGFINLLKDNKGYDFYAFADQDDVWDSGKLLKALLALEGIKGPAIYCSNCELVDENLKSLGRNAHRKLPSYNLISMLCLASCAQGCTSVFNDDLAKIVQNNKTPEIFIMHDSFLTCLCALIDGKIIYDHSSTMKYRMHGNNVFGMVSAKQGLIHLLKDRFKEISKKRKISMSDQLESISGIFNPYISQKNLNLCNIVIRAKYSMLDRMKLVFNPKLKHDTWNKTLTKKLEILLGNG